MPHQSCRRLAAMCALAVLPAWAAAQEATTISGRVTTEAAAPLPSASVFIEGFNLGTVTNEEGRYSFAVPGARVQGQRVTLTARVIGYQPQSAQITLRPGTIEQNFALELNPLRLGEVVVTGAGTQQRREQLGVTINSVQSEEILRSNEHNVVQALAAKAPNVQINQQSGEPGASSYIRIRGIKSILGTGQPLFVVDGIPIDNTTFATGPTTASTVAPNRASDINAADIESIEILKGAAAAAIYGARAAEGVVLITTKRGHAGATRYSFRSNISLDQVNQNVPLQNRYGQGSGGAPAICTAVNCRPNLFTWGPELTREAWIAGAQSSTCDVACATARFNERFPGGIQTFDHFDEVFRDGWVFENSVTVSGGSERTTFYASLGRLDHEGIIVGPNNWYDRTTVRLNATHRLRDRLLIGGNFSYIDARGSFVQKGSNVSGLMLGALRTPPEFDNRQYLDPQIVEQNPLAAHRSYRFPRPGPNSTTVGRGYDNPLFIAHEMVNESELGRAVGNINVDYDPLDWLSVRYTLGADYYGDWRLEGLPLTSTTYPTGRVIRADIINYSIDHNLVATATRTFTENLAGSLTLGQNLNSRRYRLNYTTGFDLIAPQPFALHNTVTWEPSETRSLIHTESYFGQASVDLYDQLFLTAAVRNDGFSTFGESERRHWFPKYSAAWVFTNALGLQDQRGALSYGKLRAAYGVAGREPEPYQTITAFSTGTAFTGWGDYLNFTQAGFGGLVTGATLGNQALKPERTREVEGGVDLGFLDQRVDLSVTYYNATSEDVILSLPVPPSTGFTSRLENAARMRNVGWEATLNLRPITQPNLAWDVGVNWSTNRLTVLDLQGAEFVFKAAGTFAGSYGAFTEGTGLVMRGEDFVRCGRGLTVSGIDIDNTADHCLGAPAGALYIGADGFPVYDPTDRVIADPSPDWMAGIRSSLTFGGRWQLSGLVDIRRGGEVWNGTKGALYYFGTHKDTEIRNTTQVFGQNGFYDRTPVAGPGEGESVLIDESWYTSNIGSGFTGPASQFIEDGSYVKLRELSLGYTMNQPWVRDRLGFASIDVRVAGRNLATWTDYTGIDPETNLGGAEVAFQGADYFNNPQTRSFVLSIGLNR